MLSWEGFTCADEMILACSGPFVTICFAWDGSNSVNHGILYNHTVFECFGLYTSPNATFPQEIAGLIKGLTIGFP